MNNRFAENIEALKNNEKDAIETAVSILLSHQGTSRERMALGAALGKVGDPRISSPDQDTYWNVVNLGYTYILVATYPVTIQEWRLFVAGEQYQNDDFWSEEMVSKSIALGYPGNLEQDQIQINHPLDIDRRY